MKATNNGKLNPIPDCTIIISGSPIIMKALPDIGDGKSAVYNSEPIIGRSFPLYTYSHSADRTISVTVHFFIVEPGDGEKNLAALRLIESAVYPQSGDGGAPYKPPPVCTIKCGQILAKQSLCVVLQSYSVKFDPGVAWEQGTLCPYRFSVDTTWLVVYTSSDLPFNDRIITTGR